MDSYVPTRKDDRERPYRFGRGGSQRDASGRDTFSFRAPPLDTVRLPHDRPGSPPRPPEQQRHNAQNNGSKRPPLRYQGQNRIQRGRFPRPATSQRPLLQGQRSPTPEQLASMTNSEARFIALEDLSDSGEERMQLDSDVGEAQGSGSDTSGDEHGRKRRATGEKPAAVDGENLPRWSNPDPYTSLPPPSELQGKRRDFVSLIRKARAPDKAQNPSLTAVNNDFISFDDGNVDVGSGTERDMSVPTSAEAAASNEGIAHLEDLHPGRMRNGTTGSASEFQRSSRPPTLPGQKAENATLPANRKHINVWSPPPEQASADQVSRGTSQMQSNRKRGREDDFESEPSGFAWPPTANKGLKGAKIAVEWRAQAHMDPTPWCTVDHSTSENVSASLHKEICDFYQYLRPRDFERAMRHDLVQRVQTFLSQKYFDCQVRSFGSFAADLYLPDGDMDLVVLSRTFLQRGEPRFGNKKKELYVFSSRLGVYGIPRTGSTCVIAKAKVPLVKYVDNHTGLKVDISFENNTGPIANKTYEAWKAQFPAMPAVVTLIKQMLHMRMLDDVSTGGLGGFAVTCLVVSLMQHMPQLQSNNMDAMGNLGELFMSFLDFYGNQFNTTTTAIQLQPPRYLPKHLLTPKQIPPKPASALVVIDPNNSENNITFGTKNIDLVRQTFSEAFSTLTLEMHRIRSGKVKGPVGGILGSLYAGNYSSFESQRARLKHMHSAG